MQDKEAIGSFSSTGGDIVPLWALTPKANSVVGYHNTARLPTESPINCLLCLKIFLAALGSCLA